MGQGLSSENRVHPTMYVKPGDGGTPVPVPIPVLTQTSQHSIVPIIRLDNFFIKVQVNQRNNFDTEIGSELVIISTVKLAVDKLRYKRKINHGLNRPFLPDDR